MAEAEIKLACLTLAVEDGRHHLEKGQWTDPGDITDRARVFEAYVMGEAGGKTARLIAPGKSHEKSFLLNCGFCGKNHHAVREMIAGPKVFICDECVELCMSILTESRAHDEDVA